MEQRTSKLWAWGRRPEARRMLVEDASGALGDAEFRVLESAGFDVALCTGPDAHQGCDLVEHGQCPLAGEADVILFGLSSANERQREVLRALRRRFPATPIVVEVPRQHPEWAQGLPPGCRVLAVPTSIQGQVWVARQALEATRGRIPFLHRPPPPPARPVDTPATPVDPQRVTFETVAGGRYMNPAGEFRRDMHYITTRITADGRDGYPVVPGRYHLVVSRACPWAHRTAIVRRLLGLEGVVSMGIAGPVHDRRSWTFDLDPGGRDPVLGIERLRDAYLARFPGYQRGITVPAIVDIPSGKVVTNDFAQITLDFSTEWRAHHRPGAPDLYPKDRRDEIDEIAQVVFADVNNGVYRCGFAGTQDAYEKAYRRLFDRLDWLSDRLSRQRYLVGDTITEADVRLFPTLVRFDAVYHGHFKCNRHKLTEMPVLWAYARDLFQTPGFGDTVDFDQIKRHYYQVHTDINPTGVVPAGPGLEGWLTPHGRQPMGGRPFGDGTPPRPPPPHERVPPHDSPLPSMAGHPGVVEVGEQERPAAGVLGDALAAKGGVGALLRKLL